MISVYLSNRI